MEINIRITETSDAAKTSKMLRAIASGIDGEGWQAIEDNGEETDKVKKTRKTKTADPVAATDAKPDETKTDEEKKNGLTGDLEKDIVIIRELATAKNVGGHRDAIKKLLADLGIKKVTEAPKEKHQFIYDALLKMQTA